MILTPIHHAMARAMTYEELPETRASAFFHGDHILPALRVPPSGGFGRLAR